MTAVYIDTSVLGAYYCPEPLSHKAEEYLRKVAAPVISLITEVEFFSLVAKKKRVGDFGEAKVREIWMEFQSHLENRFYRMLVPAFDHYMEAREMIRSMKAPLRTLDALHLAMARGEDLPVVTSDQILAKAARRFGIKTDLLREH